MRRPPAGAGRGGGADPSPPRAERPTPDGLPLGLTAVKVWSRDKFKGTAALKRKINPTRVPIDRKESMRWLDNLRRSTELIGAPERCVHIGDRESDIYELFCLAQDLGTNVLVRTCVDRLAEDGGTAIAQMMRDAPTSGMHRRASGVGSSCLPDSALPLMPSPFTPARFTSGPGSLRLGGRHGRPCRSASMTTLRAGRVCRRLG